MSPPLMNTNHHLLNKSVELVLNMQFKLAMNYN